MYMWLQYTAERQLVHDNCLSQSYCVWHDEPQQASHFNKKGQCLQTLNLQYKTIWSQASMAFLYTYFGWHDRYQYSQLNSQLLSSISNHTNSSQPCQVLNNCNNEYFVIDRNKLTIFSNDQPDLKHDQYFMHTIYILQTLFIVVVVQYPVSYVQDN